MTRDYSFNNVVENVALGSGMLFVDFAPRSVKTSPATYSKLVNGEYTNVVGEMDNAVEGGSLTVFLQVPDLMDVEGLDSKPIMLTAAMYNVFSAKSAEKVDSGEVSELLTKAGEDAMSSHDEEVADEVVEEEERSEELTDVADAEVSDETDAVEASEEIDVDDTKDSEAEVSFNFEEAPVEESVENEVPGDDVEVDSEEEVADDTKKFDPDEEVEYNFNIEEASQEQPVEEDAQKEVEEKQSVEPTPDVEEAETNVVTEEAPIEENADVYNTEVTSDINQNINLLSSFNSHMKDLEMQKEAKRLKQQSLLSDLSSLEEEIKGIERMQGEAVEKCRQAYQALEPTLNQLGVDVGVQFGIDPSILGIKEEQYENNNYQK